MADKTFRPMLTYADEAHSYNGAKGIEVASLVKRVNYQIWNINLQRRI